MSPLRAVILDFGGTLAYMSREWGDVLTEGAWATDAFLRQQGMANLPEDFPARWLDARRFAEQKASLEMRECRADDTLAFLLQLVGYPHAERDLLKRAVEVYFGPEAAAWQPFPDAAQTLQALRAKRYHVAVLSNATSDPLVQNLLNRMGLRPHLEAVVTSAAIDYRKPRAEAFNVILDRWDIPGHESVMVGDTLSQDIRGALDSGMWAILANMVPNPTNGSCAGDTTPDATVTRLSDILPIIAHLDNETTLR